MPNSIGRPMKVRRFISMLEDDQIYCPATIIRLAVAKGLFDPELEGDQLKLAKMRARHSLARFSANKFFPTEGDGYVEDLRGQPPLRGWTGKRWKENLPELA